MKCGKLQSTVCVKKKNAVSIHIVTQNSEDMREPNENCFIVIIPIYLVMSCIMNFVIGF